MEKRKSPRETLERHDPKVEHIYAKFPREELIDVTLTGNEYGAEHDDKKLLGVLKQREMKRDGELTRLPNYTDLHNHPVTEGEIHDEALPSTEDIKTFLQTRSIKTMAIAQQDQKTGEVQGYLLIRKKRDRPEGERHAKYEVRRSELSNYKHLSDKNPQEAMRDIARKYNLQYRWVAAKGYELPSERKADVGWRFVKKRGLEEKATAIATMFGFLGAILFFSSNLTGNIIGNSNQTSYNWIGSILFIIGLIGAFAYFRRK